MNTAFDYYILLLMLIFHVINDFNLQGDLKHLKQKSWWEKQSWYNDMYKDDYRSSLIIHSLSWSLMISIPLWCVSMPLWVLGVTITTNMLLHAYIDDLKCNQLKLSLSADQLLHILQIGTTWIICCKLL